MTTTERSALAQWLIEYGKTQVWFALKLGVSVSTMSRIVRGETMPRAATARKIEQITSGAVTATDLLHAKTASTPANRAARIRHAKNLITRGTSMLAAATEES